MDILFKYETVEIVIKGFFLSKNYLRAEITPDYLGSAGGVMVRDPESKISDLSSNSSQGCQIHFRNNTDCKVMNSSTLPSG